MKLKISLIIVIALFNVIFAAEENKVPVLDKTTVKQVSGIKKCVNGEGSRIYTQFDCPENYQLEEDDWQQEANVSYVEHKSTMPLNNYSALITETKPNSGQAEEALPKIKDIKFDEAFKNGLRYILERDQFIDEIIDNK